MLRFPAMPLSMRDFEVLKHRVRTQGGRPVSGPHKGRRLSYQSDDSPLVMVDTSGCGKHRKLRLAYRDEKGMEKSYVACADCDILPRQPRFLNVSR